ncbi:Porphobilinogen deaminase [Trichoplax sp. H2]|nr:Porphobilinogen deaminase [Trichoplax sp. H2]|eukprot:RDD44486.1 Porphobilinogen deaminase [Trichoplax sp. H2]
MSDMEETVVRIGTRKSQLAMIQTHSVVDALREIHPKARIEIVTMDTIGDRVLDKALPEIGQTNLFTKDLEVALTDNKIDLIVHSLKDVPSTLPEGLAIAAIGKRAMTADVVLMNPKHRKSKLSDLPQNSVIGTSSLRRIAQLKRRFPHLKFENVRGNLNTRLKKLDESGIYDALVLAGAGVVRMGWQERIDQASELTPDECLYAIGQGALGIEIRKNDKKTFSLISAYTDFDSLVCNAAERAFLRFLDKGCSVPIGVYTEFTENKLKITGAVFSLDGSKRVQYSDECTISGLNAKDDCESNYESLSSILCPSEMCNSLIEAERLGKYVAEMILKNHGGEVLAEARQIMKAHQK